MFKDHFSDRPMDYARFRPTYPAALFDYLAGLSPQRNLAWDCATGNGQAARALASHFSQVVGTDASSGQIAAADAADNIHYLVATAEASGLADQSVDLISVAQALHWFDLGRFYREVRRVLTPAGVLAVWSYNLLRIDPAIDALLDAYYWHTLRPYWPPERKWIENGYRDLAFPFREEEAPSFSMTANWRLEQLLGYLGTWSATQRYCKEQGMDPLDELRPRIQAAWGGQERTRTIRWPLSLRVGASDRC